MEATYFMVKYFNLQIRYKRKVNRNYTKTLLIYLQMMKKHFLVKRKQLC